MQLRTVFAASVLGLSLACVAGFASGQQIYKWKDSSGVMHFSQSPPTNGAKYTKMRLADEPAVSDQPASAATSNSEGEDAVATPVRGAETTSKADTPSNRAALCRQLSANISLLVSKEPVVAAGDQGKQQVMDDAARRQQLATARSQQAQYCSGGDGT